MEDGEKVVHLCERRHFRFDEADVVLFVSVEFDEPEFGFRPGHAILALGVAHGTPPARRLSRFDLGLEHAEVPHAEFPLELQDGAVEDGVPMIRRSRGTTAQHGIRGMFFRRHRRDRNIVPERDGVVVEGEKDLLVGGGGKRASEGEENASEELHVPIIRPTTDSGKTALLVSSVDQIRFPPCAQSNSAPVDERVGPAPARGGIGEPSSSS